MRRQWVALIVESVVWWGLCLGVWLVSLSAISGQELATATPLALPCGVLATVARRAAGNRWGIRPGWLSPALLIPFAIVTDTVRLIAATVSRPAGRFLELPISGGAGEGAMARGRRAVATVFITVTPGSIVVDLDAETGKATVHALIEGRPRMEQVVAR